MLSKNRRLITYLFAVAVGMFGFGYALVPMYSVFCKVTGLNGKTGGPTQAASAIDKSRIVTVEFLTTCNANLAFKFYPMVKKIKVHPGENTRLAFFAKNDTHGDIVVQAIPSVAPGLAAKHLKKTECFCFTRQYFKASEERIMPVLFHIDTDLPKNIHTVSLSYTLFDVSKVGQVIAGEPGKIHLG